jgi:hypothetical protein
VTLLPFLVRKVRWAGVFYPDLGTETQIASGPSIRAIGWLSYGHPFRTGRCTFSSLERLPEFVVRSSEMFAAVPSWPALAGPHRCEFCSDSWGVCNIAVPDRRVLYVAPEMVLHYVTVHHYCPPDEFVDAVVTAPLPGDPSYAERLSGFHTAWTRPPRGDISP